MSFISTVADIADQLIGDFGSGYALIQAPNRFIGTIFPDVTVREVHSDEDTITVHPVETGTPVSDHVFANPKIVEIQCGFSDSTAGSPGYVQAVYQEFLANKAARETFDVSTGKRFYSNMLFGNITVITDETSEHALFLSARLQEVIISNSSGGGSASQANQSDPQQTAASTDVGNQQLQSAPSASLYSDYEQSFGPGGIGHA